MQTTHHKDEITGLYRSPNSDVEYFLSKPSILYRELAYFSGIKGLVVIILLR